MQRSGWYREEGAASYQRAVMPWPHFMRFPAGVRAGRNRLLEGAPKEVQVIEVLDQVANMSVTAWWGVDYLLMASRVGRWMISHVLGQSPPHR